MATQSPFSFLDSVFERIAQGPQPPQWLVQEAQQRLVLLINHVLMQERAATERLVPRSGRVVRVQWRQFFVALQVTPAGLFDLAAPSRHARLAL
jgi:ubiquinone biosynthesis protein UbiJ